MLVLLLSVHEVHVLTLRRKQAAVFQYFHFLDVLGGQLALATALSAGVG